MTAGRLDHAVASLPHTYKGPGGACAVLRDGEILVCHSWGWANTERRIPFTPHTLFRMCSITKQFTCAVTLDAFSNLDVLDNDVRDRLPRLQRPPPGMRHLCHNQSGLRDYWAVGMLHGALPETPFGDAEAAQLIEATATLQFAPGTQYAYCNQNFRLLSDIVQSRTGRSFAELLRTQIFDKAGMHTAFLAADTRAMPDGTIGYEGTHATGFYPAPNNILWTGDAGLGASLDDMIAWEKHIDATRDDPASIYNRLCQPVAFADGTASAYGYGLGRRRHRGIHATGHGGALRGWRSHRLHVAEARLSVVVMFNHMGDAQEAADSLLAAALDFPPVPPATHPSPDWLGAYLDPQTGLSARIDSPRPGKIRLRYGHAPEWLDIRADGSAGTDNTVLSHHPHGVHMRRLAENTSTTLQSCESPSVVQIAGLYRCAELDATLTVARSGGIFYAACSGFLGQGSLEMLDHIGADNWAMPCPRALDHTPPGDWTLRFEGSGLELGCWLARGLRYEKVK